MIELHPEFISRRGKTEFAVLPIEEFDQLTRYLDDLEDLLSLRQAKAAAGDAPSLSLDEIRHRLDMSPE